MAKRLLDIVLGSLLAIVATPIILAVCLYSAMKLHAWPLFHQKRVGRGGRHFTFLKVRTLPPSSPAYALKTESEVARASRATVLLRRLHLDELPQLYLVPFGRMSLVGPRPKMPDTFEPVEPVYGATRVQVAQGCTGLWQISRHCGLLPRDHPEYDLFYVEQRTMRMDLWILWKTVQRVAGGSVHVGLTDVPRWCLAHADHAPEPAISIVGEAT